VTKEPWYYVLGGFYALPLLMVGLTRTPSWRLLLYSWIICMVHVQLRRQSIAQRIAQAAPITEESLMQELVQAALKHDGCLTVTQGVMETGVSFPNVEGVLNEMVASGYVYKRNNPETGVIEYVFQEVL
jgi:hypothetical protein